MKSVSSNVTSAQAQRERNREAVRKCRLRKREAEQSLRERVAQLETENARLRTRLELGTSEAKDAKDHHAEKLLLVMQGLLARYESAFPSASLPAASFLAIQRQFPSAANSALGELDGKLQQAVDEYGQRHMDYGRDRHSALGFLMGRLHFLAKSSTLSRVYLSLIGNHLDDEFYSPDNTHGPWKDFVDVLELTVEQQAKLKRRRLQAGRVAAEMKYAERRVDALHNMVRNIKGAGDEMASLTSVLTIRQLAHFIVWVNTEPACKDILDSLFQNTIRAFDGEIIEERKAIQEADTAAQEVDRLLFEVRSASGATVKKIFETLKDEELQELVRRHFHPNITVVDPNNGGEWKGREGLCKYVRMVQKSFSVAGSTSESIRNFALIDKSVTIDGPTVRGTFELLGTYSGKLSSDTESKSRDPGSPRKVVSCEIVVSISFAESSDQILELVIGMDTVSLMSQLGLISNIRPILETSQTSSPLLESSKKRPRGEGSFDEPKIGDEISLTTTPKSNDPPATFTASRLNFIDLPGLIQLDSMRNESKALRSKLHARLKDLFETDDQKVMKEIAERILKPSSVFSDSNLAEKAVGIPACVDYVIRIKRAFSRMRVVKTTLTDGATKQANNSSSVAGGKTEALPGLSDQPWPFTPVATTTATTNEQDDDLPHRQSEHIMGVQWVFNAVYTGSLLSHRPTPCQLSVDLFIGFDQDEITTSPSDTHFPKMYIDTVQLSWDISSVMAQLESAA